MNKLNVLLEKYTLLAEEETDLNTSGIELDLMYIDLAEGAFTRSREQWVEEGEKNNKKRNYKRKSLSA